MNHLTRLSLNRLAVAAVITASGVTTVSRIPAIAAPELPIQKVPMKVPAVPTIGQITVPKVPTTFVEAIPVAPPQSATSLSRQAVDGMVKPGARSGKKPQPSKTRKPTTLTSEQRLISNLSGLGTDHLITPEYSAATAPQIPYPPSMQVDVPDNRPSAKGYIWPTKGVVTSRFGWRWGRMHHGIDIAAPIGTPVVAAAAGVVVSAGWSNGGFGNLVKIRHSDGSVTLYAHNSRILVQPGQSINQGQMIAQVGSTGFSTGPHCHFEIHPSKRGAVDPIAHLPRLVARS